MIDLYMYCDGTLYYITPEGAVYYFDDFNLNEVFESCYLAERVWSEVGNDFEYVGSL